MRVAIYDGRCSICRRFASLLRKYISLREMDIVPCNSEIQKKIAPNISSEMCLKSFVLIEEDGSVLIGGDAVLRAVTLAPALEKYRALAESLAVRIAAKGIYYGISNIRKIDRD